MNVRENDFGFTIRVKITEDGATGIDVSTATTKEIILRNPKREDKRFTASFTTDGTDGLIEYTVQQGDIDREGRWYIYAKIVRPSGLNLRGTGVVMDVEAAPT